MIEEATGTLSTYSKDVFGLAAEVSAITFVALGLVIALLLISLRFGTDLVIALNLGLYIGYLAHTNFPYLAKAREIGGESPDWWADVGVFVVFTLAGFFIFKRVISSAFMELEARWLDSVLLAVSTTLFIGVLTYALFPLPHTPIVTPIFTEWLSATYLFFWWLMLPLAVIFVVSRR